MTDVQPGDVLVVRTPPTIFGWLIRFGAALRGRPNLDDHVVIAHHLDDAGVLWGIEGRPGGVGWVDVAVYSGPYVFSNADQTKTQAQRAEVCELAKAALGTPYDWVAILDDAADTLGLGELWPCRDYGSQPPGHVVCSSLAAWIYGRVGLDHPAGAARWSTPSDWTDWILRRGWQVA